MVTESSGMGFGAKSRRGAGVQCVDSEHVEEEPSCCHDLQSHWPAEVAGSLRCPWSSRGLWQDQPAAVATAD